MAAELGREYFAISLSNALRNAPTFNVTSLPSFAPSIQSFIIAVISLLKSEKKSE
ncbi:hypothetical protein D3C81_2034460 [compost metagenome]